MRDPNSDEDAAINDPLRRLGQAAEDVFESERERFDKSTRDKKLIISVFGGVNAGKSMMVNALMGRKLADVKPIAGWTREVSLFKLPDNDAVFIADTPGMQDVNESVSRRAEEFVEKESDVVLYFINAAVGVTRHERDAHAKLRAAGFCTIVVVNKIDTLDVDERGVAISDIRQKLAIENSSGLFAASAKTGEGVGELRDAIAELLTKSGKDLLFARAVKDKDRIVDAWITRAAVAASAIGLIPIPGSDTLPLTALQVGLLLKIAHTYEVEVTKSDIVPFITEIAAGRLGKMIFTTVLKGLGWLLGPPGAGIAATAAATIAGTMTYGIGKAGQAFYRSGMKASIPDLAPVFEAATKSYLTTKSR